MLGCDIGCEGLGHVFVGLHDCADDDDVDICMAAARSVVIAASWAWPLSAPVTLSTGCLASMPSKLDAYWGVS